ncbi:hypothetical protein L3Y34_009559 [Caenorhabditis briggsae]|uniref:Uncharacterized protein n=1 Tax=Caenorhabditis briggsae TaxID=6238 RepID=A0AAE9A2Z3_CAEBR|nr:hypothetical protein L3Y34_009559 [Caenorhabditis briggsae]
MGTSSKHRILIFLILAFLVPISNCKKEDSYWLDSLYSTFREISEHLPEYSEKFQKTVTGYAEEVQKHYEGSKLESFVNENAAKLYEKSQDNGKTLKEKVVEYAEKVQKHYEGSKLESFVNENAAKLYEKIQENGKVLKEKIGEYAEKVQKHYEGSKLESFVNEIAAKLYEKSQDNGKTLKEKIGDRWNMVSGGTVGAARNAANYVVQVGGRSSNILNIFDKNYISSLGNPKWYVRIDMPHGYVPYYHINVNPAITGLPDPHIQISGVTAHAAGLTGRALHVVNKVAPVAMAVSVAVDALDVANDLMKGHTTQAKKKVVSIVATNTGGYCGASAGAVVGTMFFPGVGTLVGGIVGGVFGGVGGGIAGDIANKVMQS